MTHDGLKAKALVNPEVRANMMHWRQNSIFCATCFRDAARQG
jgi:hypothetical protein